MMMERSGRQEETREGKGSCRRYDQMQTVLAGAQDREGGLLGAPRTRPLCRKISRVE